MYSAHAILFDFSVKSGYSATVEQWRAKEGLGESRPCVRLRGTSQGVWQRVFGSLGVAGVVKLKVGRKRDSSSSPLTVLALLKVNERIVVERGRVGRLELAERMPFVI